MTENITIIVSERTPGNVIENLENKQIELVNIFNSLIKASDFNLDDFLQVKLIDGEKQFTNVGKNDILAFLELQNANSNITNLQSNVSELQSDVLGLQSDVLVLQNNTLQNEFNLLPTNLDNNFFFEEI